MAALSEPTQIALDGLLSKQPANVSNDEIRAFIAQERLNRAAWIESQESKKGKTE